VGDLSGLRERLRDLAPIVVAFSGGADSAFLAAVANSVLGPDGALMVTAVSPSLAPSELADCRSLAQEWGLNYQEVETHEDARPEYRANGADRCWHCKDELMRALAPVAASFGARFGGPGARGARTAAPATAAPGTTAPGTTAPGTTAPGTVATVVLGVNLDDLGDYRPGQAAARDAGALFPLVDAGFTKDDVRHASHVLGLRTWDKPAAACLASRVPYGTPVSIGTLSAVSKAEAGLAGLGFKAMRVRHYGDLARVELPLVELGRALELREEVVRAVKVAGYRYVTLDLEGLRSGNLNASLSGTGLGGTGLSGTGLSRPGLGAHCGGGEHAGGAGLSSAGDREFRP
jgi:pyridinium-3,5-biscarboxylic acid mononucleotide sulfurtransferase